MKRNFLFGPVQMLFSAICFAFMTYFVKLSTRTIPSNEVTFFRFLLGVAVAYLIVKLINRRRLKTENFKILLVRGILGGTGVLLYFLAIQYGTITNSVVLQNTYPLFAAVLSFYILKEKAGIRLVVSLLTAFAGIVILVRPSMSSINLGDVFALVSGIVGGFAITAVRQLRQRNESVWIIFFYFCLFGAILSLALAIPSWKWPGAYEWLLVSATAVLGLAGQVTMTSAYKYCNPFVGGILSMSTCIFSFLIGLLLMGENAGILDITGVTLIIAGNMLVFINPRKPEAKSGDGLNFS